MVKNKASSHSRPGGSLKVRGRPSPLFAPLKFDDRRKIVLQIVAGVYIEPSQIPTTGSKRLKEGSKLYDEVLLIIHNVYSDFFLTLWDRDFQILIIR